MDYTQLIPVIAALAAASERLVDTVKSFLPSLSSPKTQAEQAAVNQTKDRQREGTISILSILVGIGTVTFAEIAKMFPDKANPINGDVVHDILATILMGLLTAGGSRLWNPLVELLKGLKDSKKPA